MDNSKQKYELRQGRAYAGGGIWNNERQCWSIWIGIDGNFHGSIEEFNEYLRIASVMMKERDSK